MYALFKFMKYAIEIIIVDNYYNTMAILQQKNGGWTAALDYLEKAQKHTDKIDSVMKQYYNEYLNETNPKEQSK